MKKLSVLCYAALATFCVGTVHAQAFPSRPIRLIVGYTPGGAADLAARVVSDAMSKKLGQPILVENKPGAGSTIASELVARAAPDGYTLLLTSATLYGADQFQYKSFKYQPADYTPITRLTTTPLVLVANKDLGITTVKELIELAKSKPGKLNYSSSGLGGSPHIAAIEFVKRSGIDAFHLPFAGGAPAIQAVAAGDAQFSFGTAPSVAPFSQGNRLRVLAVSTAQRSSSLPDVPTLVESGLADFDYSIWFGLFGPAGLPSDVKDKLFSAARLAMNDPEIKSKLSKLGSEASISASPEEFSKWAAVSGEMVLKRTRELAAKK